MKSLLSLSLIGLLASQSFAALYSTTGQGTSTVGSVGDDYPTLDAAAKDFSSRVGGSTGDWTLLVTANLTEPNNVAFGNSTNGFKVTVKPASNVSPTITFTTTTANNTGAYTGNWLIGTSAITNLADNMTTTSNFTIDGSNNGSTSRDMTIQNAPFTGDIQLIRVVGGTQNTTIKNCNLVSNGSAQNFDVEFCCRKVGTTSYFPTGCRVENCDLYLPTGSNAQNILFRQVQGVTAVDTGRAMDDVTITSNTIRGNRQLINMGFVANANILDNICSLTVPLASGNTPAFISQGANGASGWTVNILRNKIVNWETQAATATAGTQRGFGTLCDLGGGITAPLTGTYNVVNNFFTGFLYSSTTASGTNGIYRGVQMSGSANVNVLHNSFNMTNTSLMTTANRGDNYNVIALTATYAGNAVVRDNIIRQDQNNGVVFYRSASATTSTLTSNDNTFYLGNGAQMASYMNTTAAPNKVDLAAWQSTGFDGTSNIADPTVAAPPYTGKWVSSVDLHFTTNPGVQYLGAGAGVTTDIDNQARSVATPVKGADELAISNVSAAADWQLLQ
jgi:hypothetical protein